MSQTNVPVAPTSTEAAPSATKTESLHKKILKKLTTAKSTQPPKIERPIKVKKSESDRASKAPNKISERSKRTASESTTKTAPCTAASEGSGMESTSVPELNTAWVAAVDKIKNWEQCGISPPKEIASDAESDTASSVTDIPTPNARKSRLSMLAGRSGQRTGVEMDMATKVANEAMLQGKEALESAGKMKRECKQIALESLQTLYETVLSLSDSRSRHICTLERERTRHANELVAVERAHNKVTSELTQKLLKEMESARSDIASTLTETKAIRDWQGYETREPHKLIREVTGEVKLLKALLESAKHSERSVDLEPLRSDNSSLKAGVDALQMQLDELRRETRKLSLSIADHQSISAETLAQVTIPHPTPDNDISQDIKVLIEKVNDLKTSQLEPIKSPPPITINLDDQIQPITEKLEAVSSELRTMRQDKLNAPPPALSIDSEMTKAEVKSTYAKVTSKPPPERKPNHTLIVSTSNPDSTAENLVDRIREALDTKTTGARVDRVRKAKNRKVVLSCGTMEDLSLVQSRVQRDKTLKVEIAKAGNPLVIIRDVLSYHKDADIVDNLLSQNKNLLQDVNLQETTVRVRYRKKARYPLECHAVLEVSPKLHKNLTEAGKVYIGLQRRSVTDQSPLVQCTKCLGFGHTKIVCRERDEHCSHCGKSHTWENCKARKEGSRPKCKNCSDAHGTAVLDADLVHNAFSAICPERQKWDNIARSRISYC